MNREDDALYFRLDESAIAESEEVQRGVILDFDKDGQVVGGEFLGIKARIPEEEITTFQF